MNRSGHKLGLIGYPLSHSFSPGYFGAKFEQLNITNASYTAYSIEHIEMVEQVFELGVTGLNVTIPYKEAILPFLDELNEEALEIGAVNTIRIANGKRVGYNTDVYGFELSLKKMLNGTKVENALILGTGGASKAVKYVLHKMGVNYTVVSRRKPFLTYSEIDEKIILKNHLIVNTTPLGMSPNVEQFPSLPYSELTEQHFLYDLIYNPEKTLFLKKGELQGCSIKNGHEMLILQAEKAWEIWNQH